MAKTPKPHQKQAINANVSAFKSLDRCQDIMACGTGKTLVGIHTAQRLKAKRILVAVPTLMLLSQTIKEWHQEYNKDFISYCVCSDAHVDEHEDDSLHGDVHYLAEGVSTDPGELAEFLSSTKRGTKVVFCTYNSMDKVAESHPGAFDFFILDEAHRTACSREGLFGLALDNRSIPAKKRLFMTATRRVFKGEYHEFANSMCDEDLYGPVVYSLNFKEAITRKLVSDYRIIIAGINEKEYAKYRKHFPTKVAKASFKSANHLGSHVMLLRSIEQYGIGRIISFHSRIYKAELFASDLAKINSWVPKNMQVPGLGLMHLSSRNSSQQRQEALKAFDTHDGPSVITNARCLSEGVDIPAVDSIIFADPKKSQTDIIQAVGRAIRLDPRNKNKIGTIIVPVIVPDDADENTFLNHSNYKAIWHVINALSSMDERLAKCLDYHIHARNCTHEPDGEENGFDLTHVTDGVVTAVSSVPSGSRSEETEEEEWMNLIKFKLPTKVTNKFCRALRTKIMHPNWKKCWMTEEEAIAYCVKHNITSYKEFAVRQKKAREDRDARSA
jgi:predicted helicase